MTDSWASAAVDLTVSLIANVCVNTGQPDSGNEIASVRTIQEFLGEEGDVIEPHPGRASVVYRVRGTEPGAKRLLLIPHLDVVPADPREWMHPPFDGVRADGMVWGRGAVDMLNVTAAMVCVYRGLRDGDLPPPRGDVILAAVADEEAGGVYGAQHLVDEHWDRIACDAALTEVACPTLPGTPTPSLPVTVAEKGPAWRSFTAKGVAGHGSQPYGMDNAVLKLARAFARIGDADQPVAITEEWLAFVPYLPVSPDLRNRLSNADTVDEAIAEIAASDATLARWVHACTHMTFSPNVLVGGSKANVVPSTAAGDVDVRLLPGQDSVDLDDHFRKALGPDLYEDMVIEPVLEMSANASPTSGPLWEAIGDAADRHLGSRSLAPTMTPVTTDARFLRARGIPAYGVGLFDDTMTLAQMLGMFHGANERVSEKSIVLTTVLLGDVVSGFSARSVE